MTKSLVDDEMKYFMNKKLEKNEMTFLSPKTICMIFVGMVICVLMVFDSEAGNGPDHRDAWNKIMGVANNNGMNHPLSDCWSTFQKAIDDERGVPYMRDIIREFNVKHNKQCGHRTYFHWGFHANRNRIEKILDKCIYDWDVLPEKTKDELLSKLIDDTGERNRALIKELKTATKLTRSQASPVTAVLYDAHILLDWRDTNTRPLALPKDLLKELDKDITKISRGPTKTYNLGKELRKKLKATYYASGSTNDMKAEMMLDVLGQYMPQLLWGKYGNVFPAGMKNIKN